MELTTLVSYCNKLLRIDEFNDYCPNGLQVESSPVVRRLVTGVTASQALIDAAVAARADALLVHHGFFWKAENPCLVGIKGKRVAALMRNSLNLIAYHLPLDAHPTLGNNAQLGRLLGLQHAQAVDAPDSLLWLGNLSELMPLSDFCAQVERDLRRPPIVVAAHDRPVRRIAWCTGAAQGFIDQAARLGADIYLSGEISEQTAHVARELGIHYLAAGHHATERYGVSALGEHLADEFGLEHLTIDIDNPA
jgi:dinuclear metal center YbgI/SA1388 family protein